MDKEKTAREIALEAIRKSKNTNRAYIELLLANEKVLGFGEEAIDVIIDLYQDGLIHIEYENGILEGIFAVQRQDVFREEIKCICKFIEKVGEVGLNSKVCGFGVIERELVKQGLVHHGNFNNILNFVLRRMKSETVRLGCNKDAGVLFLINHF